MLVRLYYVSEIGPQLSDIDVKIIVGESQVRNRRLDITGMLVQTEHHFLQIIDGRKEAVDQLMSSVMRDCRHMNIRRVLEESISKRLFALSAMAMCQRGDLGDALSRIHAAGELGVDEAHALLARVLPG